MPNNGIIFKTDAIEFRLQSTMNSASGAGSGTLAKSHSAYAQTEWIPNAINVNVGIYLEVSSSDDGSGGLAWQAKYDGPGAPFGGYVVGAATFRNVVEIVARATNLKIYCKLTGSLLRVLWGAMEIYVNGTLSTTLGGVDVTSNGTGPNYVNYIGAPLFATGSCSASKVFTPPTYDPCNPGALAYMVEATATSTVNAGWRFKDQNGNWTTLDCDVWSNTIPTSGSCPYNLTFSNEVTVSNTYDIEIHCRSYGKTQVTYDGRRNLQQRKVVTCVDPDGNEVVVYDEIENPQCIDPCDPEGPLVNGYVDAYYTENWNESHGGSARAIPNLERAIVRINDDYAALWRRFDFPEVRGSATRLCVNGAVSVSTGGESVVYNDLGPDFLEVVRNATSNVEDCFPNVIYAQRNMSKAKSYSKTWIYEGATVCECDIPPGVSCPPPPPAYVGYVTCTIVPYTDPSVNQQESIGIQFPSYVGSLAGYQGHANPIMRYLGSWVNPHWNLAYHKQDWEVDGSPISNDLYWSTIKEQYLYNAALASPPRTRNSMIASPLYWDNGNQPFQDSFFGGFRWIGVSRWQTLTTSQPTNLTLSPSRPGSWTGTDCSVTLAAGGITVSSMTASTVTVDLDLANWSVDPFLLLLKANQVAVNWSLTNVQNIDVSFVGSDNASNYFGNTPGTYSFPSGIQHKYAGTWAIDNGALMVSDEGIDQLPSGVSSTYMSNNELTVGFQLAKGRQFAKLRFTITPVNQANPVTINWPNFTLEHTHPMLYWENTICCSMLWHNAMNVRWGQLQWYDISLGFQDPPLVKGLGTTNTVIDALAFKYRILSGSGGASLAATITTDLSTLYDSYEGQSISVVDKFSTSFILPKGNGHDLRIALVNSFSELPPIACFPTRKRSTNTWLATDDYAQVVYDHCQDYRYLISASSVPAKLQTDAGVDSGATLSPGEPGWHIWRFRPTLYNNEWDWRIVSDQTTFAYVRPWHGWFTLLRMSRCANSMDIDFASDIHVASHVLTNGDVQISTSDNGVVFVLKNTLSLNAKSACIKIDRSSIDQRLWLVIESAGQIKLYTALKAEETWTLSATIGNGSKPFIVIGRDGNRYIYFLDGVAIKGRITDRAGTIQQVAGQNNFTVINGGVDDECIAADEDVFNGGNRRLILIDQESGSLMQRESLDGITFS